MAVIVASAVAWSGCAAQREANSRDDIDAAVASLMERERVPGMAIAVIDGETTTIRCFGVADREGGGLVTPATIFELGSISKTYTALLAADVVIEGALDLSDPASRHLPELAGSPIGEATAIHLATYVAGGLPLQVPESVTDATLVDYLRGWKPEFVPGATRLYSNPSIGLFGMIAARAAGADFATRMTTRVLPSLGLNQTHLHVPEHAQSLYAFGVDRDGQPRRVRPGVFDDEAYGIKASVADVARYLRLQMNPGASPTLGEAIALTHSGWYSVGPMTQGLGWEMYPYPLPLAELIEGNSPEVLFESKATRPPRNLGADVLYNKTGSTAGFGAYVAFAPSRRIGVAILANRSVPINERVQLAYEVLRSLDVDLRQPPYGARP